MDNVQIDGVHHITLTGADRQTSIDFWQGLLGMPFIFEQPNLDDPKQNHLYFDPGDGRLITIFTNEDATKVHKRTPTDAGCVHHLAFNVNRKSFENAVEQMGKNNIPHSVKDRGFMDSLYFREPLGLTIELACYKFDPPEGFTHSDILAKAYKIRLELGDYSIDETHLDAAVKSIVGEA